MNRRSFFNKLSAAVLGTAIALKIPDSLVPQINIEKKEMWPEIINDIFFTDKYTDPRIIEIMNVYFGESGFRFNSKMVYKD